MHFWLLLSFTHNIKFNAIMNTLFSKEMIPLKSFNFGYHGMNESCYVNKVKQLSNINSI